MKKRTLEQIETEMAKLRKQKDKIHTKRQALAAERRELILSQSQPSGGLVVSPEPASLSAKTN